MEKKQKKAMVYMRAGSAAQLAKGGCKPERSKVRHRWEAFLKEQSKSLWNSGNQMN